MINRINDLNLLKFQIDEMGIESFPQVPSRKRLRGGRIVPEGVRTSTIVDEVTERNRFDINRTLLYLKSRGPQSGQKIVARTSALGHL